MAPTDGSKPTTTFSLQRVKEVLDSHEIALSGLKTIDKATKSRICTGAGKSVRAKTVKKISKETGIPLSEFETPRPGPVPALNELLTRKSAARAGLRKISKQVNKQQESATVVFFDLVGSSGFRVSAGAERGLEKAYQHNLIVSEAIIEAGGIVVKWLGDGVMGVFRGKGKTWPAFKAALSAIDHLAEYNSDNFPNDAQDADRIISRVGICDGPVHFLTVPAEDGRPALTIDDPIGTPADLASRLESLAGDSVILLEESAFQQIVKDGDVTTALIPLHREPQLARTYHPATACLAVLENGLAVRSLDVDSETDVLLPEDVVTLSRQQVTDDESIVFASNPIDCNVKGWRKRVSTVAVSREPLRDPVREVEYVPADDAAFEKKLEKGEEFYRQGKEKAEDAFQLFQEIHTLDPRSFRANFRLAQHYQKKGDAQQAREHWMAAKQADPHHPRVWAMAGVYHLLKALEIHESGYVNSTPQEYTTELDLAITDFERARQLSRNAFDSTLEHYCASLLAVSVMIRRTIADIVEGRELVDELNRWDPSSLLMAILRNIAKMLSAAASGTEVEIDEAAGKIADEAKEQLQHLQQHECMNGDTIQTEDLDLLISMAEQRLKMSRKRVRREAAAGGT
jgi:class 3 adenylate cyclase